MSGLRPERETVRAVVAAVVDPEMPVLTIDDLGVLRDVTVGDDGRIAVTITPTYSGCPAIDAIRADIERALAEAGFADAVVRTVLAPAWTTEWMSGEGRRKLSEHGIAPPSGTCGAGTGCPRCGSADTHLISRFGPTPCQALRACDTCLEPFGHFKDH